MNETIFLDAVSSIDIDVVERFLTVDNRLHQSAAKKRRTRTTWTVALAASLILAIGLGIGIPALMQPAEPAIPPVVEQPLPTDMDNILWATPSDSTDTSISNAIWNEWEVVWELYTILEKAEDDDYIAVTVSRDIPEERKAFVYNGKTEPQLLEEVVELGELRNKLNDFHEIGEFLKYGEKMYTTGSPGGKLWSKDYYDQIITLYGEDFIAEYIIDGVVQHEKLDEALQKCNAKTQQLSDELATLHLEYRRSYAEAERKKFEDYGVHAYIRNEIIVVLILQKSELANLNIENKEDYCLYSASRTLFDTTSPTSVVTDANS